MTIRRVIMVILKCGIITVLVGVLLFSGDLGMSAGAVDRLMREVVAVFRDPSTQWMVFPCLGIYFLTFAFQRHRSWRLFASNSTIWVVAMLVVVSVVYALEYSGSTDALVLLGGAVIGQGAGALAEGRGRKVEDSNQSRESDQWAGFIVVVLMVLLVVASVWRPESIQTFEYRSRERWSGPWENPNIFGLLMGAGVVLALAFGAAVVSGQWSVSSKRASGAECQVSGGQNGKSWKKVDRKWRTILGVLLCFIAVVLMGRGLLHSYSRGAWVAAICGAVYLLYQVVRCQVSGRRQRTEVGGQEAGDRNQRTEDSNQKAVFSFRFSAFNFLKRRNWVALSVVLLSAAVLCFWQFRWTEWALARRAFSAANSNDFSWRNRINAWEGALQMMAEHPWLGVGWNRTERLYEHYYLPSKLTESAAMQMNDYLALGATIGVPGLVCLYVYFWMSLFPMSGARCQVSGAKGSIDAPRVAFGEPSDVSPPGRKDAERSSDISGNSDSVSLRLRGSADNSEWLQTVCRTGAIVLAVGFWFDGGLFKLPTAATFWILLELGRADVHRKDAERSE